MKNFQNITLNNGATITHVGLGTANLENPALSVYEGIKIGVRLIDTAPIYNNEKEVGQGIKRAIDEGLVKREDLFIITKIWPTEEDSEEKIMKSLIALGLEYVDLYLIHWLVPAYDSNTRKFKKISMIKLWSEMETFVEKKLTKSIGVSNVTSQLLIELINTSKILPVVNEIEMNPYLDQFELKQILDLYNIKVIAYNSFVKGPYVKEESKYNIFDEEIIINLSKKYQKSKGQIILSWAINQGMIVIPKANSLERINENLNSQHILLSEDDIKEISKLNKNKRFCYKDDVHNKCNVFV